MTTMNKNVNRRPTRGAASAARQCSVSIWVLLLSNLFVFQLMYFRNKFTVDRVLMANLELQGETIPPIEQSHGLTFQTGNVIALPSLRINEKEGMTMNRKIFGGEGDKKHLGGFTEIDLDGISPAVWNMMVSYFGVKSLLDVGCGRGISTSWFVLHGVDALCVEGSHDAVSRSMLPNPATQVVEHDFSRGPWWPSRTVDAIWCVEFLEHVGRNFHKNYLPAFRKAALIFVTHSRWGGWHHVEVHDSSWWINKFESYGFKYSDDLTELVKQRAMIEEGKKIPSPVEGKHYSAGHVATHMMVFVNPLAASLPEHAHLFPEHGCFDAKKSANQQKIAHRECGEGPKSDGETRLPKSFYPLELTDEMDKAWEKLVRKNINNEVKTTIA